MTASGKKAPPWPSTPLLLGLIAIALIATIGLFKDSIAALFTKATSTLNSAAQ